MKHQPNVIRKPSHIRYITKVRHKLLRVIEDEDGKYLS